MRTLNQKYGIAPDTFVKYRLDLPIAEALNADLSPCSAVTFTNLFGQSLGTGTGKNFC